MLADSLEVSAEALEALIPSIFKTGGLRRAHPRMSTYHGAAPSFRFGPRRAKDTLMATSGAFPKTRRTSAPRSALRMQVSLPGVTGGPPPGVTGRPPPGTPGGPPAGAGGPGGPPKGGPPPGAPVPNPVLDALFEFGFGLLYAFEPEGQLDSSKNLRVLWVRALLASLGKIEDDVAFELLPASSRWVVGKAAAPLWPAPVVEKLGWIAQRTEFIDSVLDGWLAQRAAGQPAQVVLLGSGYDTRALRYAKKAPNLTFFEVDLPDVVKVKASMSARAKVVGAAGAALPVALPLDLNAGAGTVFAKLKELGLQPDVPTLVVVEAVLFYLSPPAKSSLLGEVASLLRDQPQSEVVLTDNLAPFVRGPMRPAAEAYLSPMGLDMLKHDTLWGGAIQFVHAKGGEPSGEPLTVGGPPLGGGGGGPPPGTPGGPPLGGGPPPGAA